jgi:catechol 2,3-dioxygenase-like lactoylglutathione lyase family enzyme
VTEIHHVGLTVSDLDRSLAFWRDALGMEVVMAQVREGGYLEAIVGEPGAHVRMAQLTFPDTTTPRVELFQYLVPIGGAHRSRPADVGFAHVCLACPDLDALLERDPDGHVVELFQPAPGA